MLGFRTEFIRAAENCFSVILAAFSLGLLMTMGVFAQNAPGAAPSKGQDAAFEVRELRVLGNTVLDDRSVESAIYPFTGPEKHMTDVEGARAALERVYHDRGFGTVFVDIPEQSVEDGIVRLKVTEGRLRQVKVVGARYFSDRAIRAALPAAQENAAPNLPALQNQLTALNTQSRDLAVVPVLKAGPTPGTVDLALKVDDHLPFHGSVELNNQYTADTTHLRAVIAASYDNLFGRLDSLSLQYQESPSSPQQAHVLAGIYTMRLGADGSTVSFQYIDSKSDVATIGTLGVLGSGSVYGVRWSQPLPAKASSQDFAVELDYKDFTQSIDVNPTSGLETPIQYINMTAAYSGAKGMTNQQMDWSTSMNFGLRGTPNNAQEFADKRYNADPNYFYFRTDDGYTLQLPARFSATVRFTGQFAIEPLISNEQLPIGGAGSVRGYLEAEELGDSAVRGSFQIGAPTLSLLTGHLTLGEFVFADSARQFTIDPLPGEAHHSDLRSWGAGLKLEGASHFYGTLTWAYPLVDGSRTYKGDQTLLFVIRGYL